MTRLANTAESGLSAGTTVTTANSDDGSAGDAFSNVTIGAGAAITFESTSALHGSLGYKIQYANANTFCRLGATGTGFGATLAVRFYFKISAAPGAASTVGRILNSSSAVVLQFRLNTTPTIQILNSAGTGIGTSSTLSTGTWYRVECWVTPDTSTTGRIGVNVYAGEATTSPVLSFTNTGTNLGTAAPKILEIGRSSGNVSIVVDFDSLCMDDQYGENFIGPAIKTATATGIASAEAFGTPAHSGDLIAEPTGVASAEAFGTPTAQLAVTASPTGISTGEAFGDPTATLGSVDITATPTGIASGEAFGTPAHQGALTAEPTGIASGEAFGTPTAQLALTATPTGIPSEEAFGTPAVAQPVTAEPTGIPSGEAFGTPSADVAIVASPTGIPSGEIFGTPAHSGDLIATADGIASGEAFGTPAVAQDIFVIAFGIPSAEAFGMPRAIVKRQLVLGAAHLTEFSASLAGPSFELGDARLTDWEAGE